MVSDVSLETCSAFKVLWNNKFRYQVASCWLLLPSIWYEVGIELWLILRLQKAIVLCGAAFCVCAGMKTKTRLSGSQRHNWRRYAR